LVDEFIQFESVPGSSPACERQHDWLLSVHRFESGSCLATFGSTTIPFGRRTTKSIWRIAGGGNFIPAESWSTQRSSCRFSHARFREDLDASQFVGLLPKFLGVILDMSGLVVKTIVEIRFSSWNCGRIQEKRLKTKIEIMKTLGTKTQPDSAFRSSVTAIEEQGILESFARLLQAEREIIRRLLDEFGSQRVA
jgi:hypothetical protein